MKSMLLVILGLLLLPFSAYASDYEGFSKELAKPYGHYKKALSLTSKKDGIQKAKEALAEFDEGWKRLTATYAEDAPKPFAWMKDYSSKIRKPAEVSKKAMMLLEAGDYAAAHSVLEEIRYILWEVRISSGIVSLNDRVNDFHEAMEIVLNRAEAAKGADDLKKTHERYGMWLTIKWEEVGVSKDFGSEEKTFRAAVKEGREAVIKLNEALLHGDKESAKKAGNAVKESYKKIFFLPL